MIKTFWLKVLFKILNLLSFYVWQHFINFSLQSDMSNPRHPLVSDEMSATIRKKTYICMYTRLIIVYKWLKKIFHLLAE